MLVGKRRRLLRYLQSSDIERYQVAHPGARPPPMIEPGSSAPDFTLPDQDGNKVSLADFRGRTVVLVFYPSDFSPVCTDQLSIYQEVLPQFEERARPSWASRWTAPSATRPSGSTLD